MMNLFKTSIRIPSAYPLAYRSFSSSNVYLAKKSKGKKNAPVEEEVDTVDLKKLMEEARKKFDEALELHQKKINEVRLGKANPAIFDKLKVKVDGEETLFTSVAQTTVKGGRFLNVTVFDPNHTKTIVSTILASGLNMTPEVDKANQQMLKVPLPPPTAESKKVVAAALKKNFENFKNHPHNKHCLANIRHHYLKDFVKEKSDPDIKKFVKDFEGMRKKYADLLSDQFTNAEKTLMK